MYGAESHRGGTGVFLELLLVDFMKNENVLQQAFEL